MGRGSPLACLIGTWCAVSIALIVMSAPKALKRLMQMELVSCADSLVSSSGNPRL